MGAGESAAREAQRERALAETYARCVRDAHARADRWAVAARTEAVMACRLDGLAVYGWRLLHDRRWPGTSRANVDHLAVGPGGVLVIDVKAWAEPRVDGDRLYRGDEDRTDDLDTLLALTARVEESVAEAGLPAIQVVPVIALAGRHRVDHRIGRVHVLGEADVAEHAVRRGARLTAEQVAAVAAVLERDFVPYDTSPAATSPVVAQPVLPREPAPDLLFDTDALVAAQLEAALAEPLEKWMTWLHPEQSKFVRRTWTGPARVAGPAGTGKTVVGLHRTAYLARTRPGRLLFVTYVRTLPEVLRSGYARLSPETADRVEFTGLYRWALRLLNERGAGVRLDADAAAAAFDEAWERVGAPGPLARLRVAPAYWRDEIHWVLKGRGLTEYASYSGLERVGRRTRMRSDHRAAMWDLYETYERLLRDRGVHDFSDVLSMALAEVRRSPLDPPYAAVVVDEVQDLTCVGVRLLHAVAGDRPDSLLLIGDGTQAVYPGGFRLAEAGVGVVGRSVLLRTNYRNTTAIVRAAARVGATPAYDDPEAIATDAHVVRDGGVVVEVTEPTVAAHDAALVRALRAALARPGVAAGEAAVLVPSRALVRTYVRVLAGAGLPAADLVTFDGTEDGRVRVGTFKRAKGLEFKYVFLPRLTDDPPRETDENEAAYRERCEQHRREVHVGMTRARDGLWLGRLAAAAAASRSA